MLGVLTRHKQVKLVDRVINFCLICQLEKFIIGFWDIEKNLVKEIMNYFYNLEIG
jgi:hypothetical protein